MVDFRKVKNKQKGWLPMTKTNSYVNLPNLIAVFIKIGKNLSNNIYLLSIIIGLFISFLLNWALKFSSGEFQLFIVFAPVVIYCFWKFFSDGEQIEY